MKEKKEAKSVKDKKLEKLPDTWDVLLYPSLTEKSMGMIETQNKLVFIVNKNADKETIKKVFEKEFNVKVESVKTEITTKGKKKAYIKLMSDYSASDIASKLGMI